LTSSPRQKHDKWVVDGILARFSALVVSAAGTVLRAFQTGVVHVYATLMVIGLALVGAYFVVPHAEVTVATQSTSSGPQYVVTAAPGLGYGYRWHDEGKPESQQQTKYTEIRELKVPVDKLPRVIGLEVVNAFGLHGTEWVILPGAGNAPPAGTVLSMNDGHGQAEGGHGR